MKGGGLSLLVARGQPAFSISPRNSFTVLLPVFALLLLAGCGTSPPAESATVSGCDFEQHILRHMQQVEESVAAPGSVLPANEVVSVVRVADGDVLKVPGLPRCKPFLQDAQQIAEGIVRKHVPEVRDELWSQCRSMPTNMHDTLGQAARAEYARHLARIDQAPGACTPMKPGMG